MNKVPYPILAIEVDKLYDKEFPPGTSDNEIERHCEFIAEFIRACGWTEDEYILRYVGGEDLTGQPADLHCN